MLVLSRRQEQTVLIGDNIEVTVLSIHSGKVRLGFKAPDDVHIVRREAVDKQPRQRDKKEG